MSAAEFDDMAEACVTAGEHVMASGSPKLQSAMRVVLFILGGELAERERGQAGTVSSDNDGIRHAAEKR